MKRQKVPARLLFSFSMMADKNKLYQEVFHVFKSAYWEKSAQVVQQEAIAYWLSVRKRDDVSEAVKQKLSELANVRRKATANLYMFWSKASILYKHIWSSFTVYLFTKVFKSG